MNLVFVYVLILGISSHVSQLTSADDTEGKEYLNQWLAEIPGGPDHAQAVVSQHGYKVERQLRSFQDHYVLRRSDVPHRARREANYHTEKLSQDRRVKFSEQQHQKHREKRGLYSRNVAESVARSGGLLNDPFYAKEWYINPDQAEQFSHTDMGVRQAWSKGYSGKGIVVTILDDGIEGTHPDIVDNYDPKAGYDFNDDDDDPTPRYDSTNENKHGTRCAGEVAMMANNNICGVGIAFNSKVGGVRMLDGTITDHLEGDSIGLCQSHVDVCSASWGPNDDGKTLEGPGRMAAKGIRESIEKGRKGKGAIIVWAAGNGGRKGDNCNADGYTSSIYTLTVTSATQSGAHPWYAEDCSSILAAAYSSGSMMEGKVVSTDLRGSCTSQHSGTSAAAPLAAGIVALALEANPNLTWRDMQHLVVFTSSNEQLKSEEGWYKNGIGYCVNVGCGFGMMNASYMVDMAVPSVWEPVGPQKLCTVESQEEEDFPKKLRSGSQIEVEFQTDGCEGQVNEIRYLEHVVVEMTLTYEKRGNIYAEIESPSGTITPLMLERYNDKSKEGFKQWPLMSTHNWGENPSGTWKFRVADRSKDKLSGELKNVILKLYGTKEKPFYHQFGPKDCGDVKRYPVKESPSTTAQPTTSKTTKPRWQNARGTKNIIKPASYLTGDA